MFPLNPAAFAAAAQVAVGNATSATATPDAINDNKNDAFAKPELSDSIAPATNLYSHPAPGTWSEHLPLLGGLFEAFSYFYFV
uniref:Secreted protein n=1 Tax=Syphacia muris TaxID=451379 RepID=A0A0N5AA57_9BILA